MDLSMFTTKNKFLMLALDHRESFRKLLNPQNPEKVTDEEMVNSKREILNVLSDQFSGVLLDPEIGLSAYENKTKPYLLSIEKSGFKDINGNRLTELEYTVEELKNKGASGIKLLIYYDHDSSTANTQMETAKKVLSDCHAYDVPLFLEIVTYNEKGMKAKQIVNAVSMFLDQGIKADVFKLEYPESDDYCKLITNYLDKIPWILLTRGEDFDVFKSQLKNAVSFGASGFLAGRSLWKDAVSLSSSERMVFLKNVTTKRFREISEIALE